MEAEQGSVFGLIREIFRAVGDKALSHIAAGVAFYMLFSIFPAFVVAITLASLWFEPSAVLELVALLEPVLPEDVYGLIASQAQNTVATSGAALSLTAAISLLLAFWSASAAVRALVTAMSLAHPATARFGVLAYYLISFVGTLFGFLAVLATLALLLLAPLVLDTIRWAISALPDEAAQAVSDAVGADALSYVELPLLIGVSVAILTLLYRLGAARGRDATPAAFRGAAAATALWLIGSKLLAVYLAEIGDFSRTYGPLGAVAGLMLWFWISAFALLVGAEVAAALSGGRRPSAHGEGAAA